MTRQTQLTNEKMADRTLFLFHSGRTYPAMERWASRWKESLVSSFMLKISRYLEHQRNPRSCDYMVRLAGRVFPGFDLQHMLVIEGEPRQPILDLSTIQEVVLLWPDANGTGWAKIERQVFRQKASATRIVVLNGRCRHFSLDRKDLIGFKWRRFLEKAFVMEMGVLGMFLVTSPWLAFADLLRRRR